MIDQELHEFLKELRNILTHSEMMDMSFTKKPQNGRLGLYLKKRVLLETGKWNEKALRWIGRQEEQIVYKSFIVDYHSQITAFYDWLLPALKELNREEYAKSMEIYRQAPDLMPKKYQPTTYKTPAGKNSD